MNNILVTAIGSASSQAIRLSLCNIGCNVFACDIYPSEYLVDTENYKKFFQIPPASNSNEYLVRLIEIIKENNIECIIPLTDIECDLLSSQKALFNGHGISIACFDAEMQSLCRNKLLLPKSINMLCDCIPTYTKADYIPESFPIMLKQISGRSSQNQLIAHNLAEFEAFVNLRDDYIIQPFLDGDIFTVDCVRDKLGNFVSVVRQELLRTVNGLGTAVRVFSEHILNDIVKSIADKLGFIGTVNMEFIYNNGKYYFLEINPRFSGGVGFSQIAGYDFVNAHLIAHTGEKINTDLCIKDMYLSQNYKKSITAYV